MPWRWLGPIEACSIHSHSWLLPNCRLEPEPDLSAAPADSAPPAALHPPPVVGLCPDCLCQGHPCHQHLGRCCCCQHRHHCYLRQCRHCQKAADCRRYHCCQLVVDQYCQHSPQLQGQWLLQRLQELDAHWGAADAEEAGLEDEVQLHHPATDQLADVLFLLPSAASATYHQAPDENSTSNWQRTARQCCAVNNKCSSNRKKTWAQQSRFQCIFCWHGMAAGLL